MKKLEREGDTDSLLHLPTFVSQYKHIARHEGVIACCEDPHERERVQTFKLKLKYWVYYNLTPDRQVLGLL